MKSCILPCKQNCYIETPRRQMRDTFCFQKGTKLAPKTLPKCSQNQSKINEKSMKIASWRILSPKSPKRPKMTSKRPFVCHSWGPSWRPIWGHVGPKNLKESILKAYKKHIMLDIDFSSILEPLGLHFGRVLGPMLASKSDKKSISS